MSQPRSVDAALPVTVPAQRDTGSAKAPRNWRVAWRLIILVAIPTMLGLVLTGLRVSDLTRSSEAYGQVSRLAVLGQQASGLVQAMEDERADTAAFISAGRPAAGLAALRRQYVITDGWAATVRRLVRQDGRGYPARTQAGSATALASIAELPGLRRDAVQSQAPVLSVISGYSAATAGLFPVSDGIADPSGNSSLITSVLALGSLSRMTDQASQQQAILGAALAAGRFGPGARTALITAQAQQASDLASFRGSATREESWALARTLASPPAAQAAAVEQRAAAAGDGALALGAPASQQWSAGMSLTVGWMRQADRQLSAWVTSRAQALQRSAMQAAVITGAAALAVLLLVLLVTLIMARSMVRVHREAVRLAGEEARRRRSISAISASFFRRSHALLERLLRLIDSLELSEDDPRRLASLFQIDHLVTRMRRHSDSALVLAGHETSSDWTEPVTVVDVLRAAVSEIEQYNRVVVDVQLNDAVNGSAVSDLVHLLAELLENATMFSAKTTQVIVSGHLARGGGLLIDITDAGLGVPEEQLRQLNWELAHPPTADAGVTRHMGLFAVAHLAARHGIQVTLALPPGGGTTAEVYLPAVLISPAPAPPGWQGQAGESRQAAGPAPSFAAAWPGPQVAELEHAELEHAEPEHAEPERAELERAEPGGAERDRAERERAEPAGGLPIFESVESRYPYTLARSLLRAGEPQPAEPDEAPVSAAPAPGPAEMARDQVASFQRGSARARAVAQADPDTRQRARDR
jgi:signal transduction histidine kinase